MARDYVTIGGAPSEEDCAQVGQPDYPEKSKKECRRFLGLIRKKLGPEPFGAQLAIKAFDHEFGTYREVVCWYYEEVEEAFAYAYKCEDEAPTTWGDTGESREVPEYLQQKYPGLFHKYNE